jgi:predicted Zn-dependent protease
MIYCYLQDQSLLASHVGASMAHEIGHNFGLVHDTKGCQCSDRVNNCIMDSSADRSRYIRHLMHKSLTAAAMLL